MASTKDAGARVGLMLAPVGDEDDPGIYAVYPGLPREQGVTFRTVLTDEILDAATEAANKTGKYLNGVFKRSLIKAMVLRSNVRDRRKDPTSENPCFDLKDDATLKRLPGQFTSWLVSEINRCDGGVESVSEVEIGGATVTFRAPAGLLGEGE